MNGAQTLIRTLVGAGVDVCFSNPGTSEMHFVAALDDVPEMRGILCLFEGVATGAADGYGRVTGRPAATLLHLGPGMGNGIANLHNARRARTPMVNVVGDHATFHKRFDAPLESDIESLARMVPGWFRISARSDDLAEDAAVAVRTAMGPPGEIATLVLPADVSWSDAAGGPAPARAPRRRSVVPGETIEEIAKVLRSGEPVAILVGGSALDERGLVAAHRVASASGAKLFGETFPANLERGAGIPTLERLGYFAEFTQAQLQGALHLILVDAGSPVSFFAYPGKPSNLVPEGALVHVLAEPADDAALALESVAELLGAPAEVERAESLRPDAPSGALNLETLAAAIGATLPEGVIVVDEGNTSSLFVPGATAGSPRHHWLTLTGGAIGFGLPAATGAAVGAPDQRVLCLQADGSAMYTLQALWTQARESLDVTTVLMANGSYAILNIELSRVGAGAAGTAAAQMLDISRPDLDFVALAQAMGVPAQRVETAEGLVSALQRSYATPGPALIEAALPRIG